MVDESWRTFMSYHFLFTLLLWGCIGSICGDPLCIIHLIPIDFTLPISSNCCREFCTTTFSIWKILKIFVCSCFWTLHDTNGTFQIFLEEQPSIHFVLFTQWLSETIFSQSICIFDEIWLPSIFLQWNVLFYLCVLNLPV